MTIMQGDAYNLPVDILNEENIAVTPADVADVEISIGSLRKTYAAGDITYDAGQWIFPLTQEETFKMLPRRVKVQIRVKWRDGSVEGTDLGYKNILESMSKEVL